MNPNHAACFNELKELCRRYGLTMGSNLGAYFDFLNSSSYYSVKFNAETESIIGPGLKTIDIPPPETKGEKNERS